MAPKVVFVVLVAGASCSSKKREPPNPAAASSAAQAPADRLPPLSQLPRLKPLWEAKGLSLSGHGGVAGELMIAREIEPGAHAAGAIVALDSRTGETRWKAAAPEGTMRLAVVRGRLLALGAQGTVIAYVLADGARLWSRETGCMFLGGLAGAGDRAVGSCMPASKPDKPLDVSTMRRESFAVAFDLASGNDLWRVRLQTRLPGRLPVDTENAYVLAMQEPEPGRPPEAGFRSTLQALSLSEGKPRWTATAADMAMVGFTHAGLVIVTGQKVQAFRGADGSAAWSYEPPRQPSSVDVDMAMSMEGTGPPLHEGLLLLAASDRIDGLDLASGRVARTWALPVRPATSDSAKKRFDAGMTVRISSGGGRILARLGTLDAADGGALVIFEGDARQVVQSPVGPFGEMELVGDLVVAQVEDAGGDTSLLRAYSLGATEAAEATALPPIERVRAILARASLPPGQAKPSDESMAELRAIPDFGKHLVAIAGKAASPQRQKAIVLIGRQKIAEGVPVLLAILDQTVPPIPKDPMGDEFRFSPDRPPTPQQMKMLRDYRPPKEYVEAMERYVEAAGTRAAATLALTQFDRPDVAVRLAPMLAADEDIENGADVQPAIYRLLARVGGASEVGALGAFDERNRVPGGWAKTCTADDALEADPERKRKRKSMIETISHGHGAVSLGGSGPCRGGKDAGPNRVTQSDAGVWLRRKGAGGLGAPVLALQTDDERMAVVEKVAHTAGRIAVRGTRHAATGREPWSAEIDAEKAFADGDGDGIPDSTEAWLGTDGKAPDSDGDGVRDGDDPSPLAKPASGEAGRVQAEIVAYASRLRRRGSAGLVIVNAPRDAVAEVAGVAAVVLHRDPPKGRDRYSPRADNVVSIDQVSVTGDAATAKMGRGLYIGDPTTVKLRRVGGVWRVADVENESPWVE